MRNGSKITIVIPTLDEEENLPRVLDNLPAEIDEVIVVDGHSKDNTVKIAKEYNCKVIYDDKGKGSALREGAKEASGDIVINMDADCSNKANELGLLIEGIRSGYDICMGSRFIQGGGTEDMPWYRKFGNKFFVFLVNFFWGMNYSDLCYGYRSFRSGVMEKLDLESDGFGIETEMSIKASKLNMRILEVPSFEKERASGSGKLKTFSDGWNILKRIIKEFFKWGE